MKQIPTHAYPKRTYLPTGGGEASVRSNIVIAIRLSLQARPLPTGSQDHEGEQQYTDESSRREAGKKPSSSAQDEKKEPSADTSADPNNKSPCNNKEFIHALCGPMSALWQIGSSDPQRSRLMLGAANVCTLLDSFHFPSYPLSQKPKAFLERY